MDNRTRNRLQELFLLFIIYFLVYETCLYGSGLLVSYLTQRGVSAAVLYAAASCAAAFSALFSLRTVLKRTGQKPAVLYAPAPETLGKSGYAAVLFDLSAGLFLALFLNLLFLAAGKYLPPGAGAAITQPALFGISLPLIPSLLIFGFLLPFCEEAFFRGILFREAFRCIPFTRAAVFSSLLFSVYHGNISQGIYAFFMGLYLCRMERRYRSLRAPFSLHALINTVILVMVHSGFLQTAVSFFSTVE